MASQDQQPQPTGPTPDAAVPGPTGLDRLRVVAETLRGDITDGLAHVHREYGSPARLGLPGSNFGDALIVSQPDHVEHVLETNQSNYRKPDVYLDQLSFLGDGLVTSQGEAWRDQHRLLMPLFQQDSVGGFADVIVDQTADMLDRWQRIADGGGRIDLLDEMARITLRVLGRTMFSSDLATHYPAIQAAMTTLRDKMARQQSPIPYPAWWLDRQLKEPVETLHRIARDLIRKRQGSEDAYDDLLSMMLTAGEGAGLDPERIVDNVVTFLVAGHETTATALTWTWYLLATHPDHHRRLREGLVDTSLEQTGVDMAAAGDELGAVTRTVQESMRLYPPVPLFTRAAVEDDTLGQMHIPGGTMLVLSQWLTHRDPAIWDDPGVFRPDRFQDDPVESRPRYSFYPFGGGARMCIGRQFALLEAQLILGLALSRMKLELASSPSPKGPAVSTAVTMQPDAPIEMTIARWGT